MAAVSLEWRLCLEKAQGLPICLVLPLQLEEAQGQPDEEAQQLLKTLQERMDALESAREASTCKHDASADRAGPSDIEIASSIDRCVCCMQH